MTGYIIFICSMAMAILCITYDSMARAKGWPVGVLLSKDASLPKITAFITAIWILIKSFLILHWWSPIVILIAGWFLGFFLTMLIRKMVQPICIIGIFPAFLFTILYISEDKPLGWLHKFLN